MRIKGRSGQALMELAVGMFALVLIVSALCGFAEYIAKSLKVLNRVRVGGKNHDSLRVPEFAARYVFGDETVNINEPVKMPPRVILK